MLKLQSIHLRNWCKTAEATIEFPEKGFVYMRGPIGTGKTALGEAINRTLLGQSFCTALASYSRDRQGDTYVDVHATFRGEPLRVELGYRCKEFPDNRGEGLRYTLGDRPPVERPQAALTRGELTEMLGVTPAVSLWTVFMDGERLKFNPPFLSQAEALSLLMQALNQPPWEIYKERAERRRNACQEALVGAKAKLQQLQSSQQSLEQQLEAAQAAYQREDESWGKALGLWEEAQRVYAGKLQAQAEQITAHAATRDRLRLEIQEAQAADAAACGKIDLELTRLSGERRVSEKYLAGWADTAATDRATLRRAEADLHLLVEGKNCPSCQRPLAQAASPEQIEEKKRAIEGFKQAVAESTEGKQECERCITAIDRDITALHLERKNLRSAKLDTLSRELELVETRLSSADRLLRTLEQQSPTRPNDTALREAKAIWAERLRQQQQHVNAIYEAAGALTAAERAFAQAAYWVRGFSSEGIPNLVLRQTVGPLNEAAKVVSHSLSGGLVQVSFSAETELASGTVKPKLVTEVNVRDGATEFLRNSKGEACLANLIIAETQTQVGRVLQRVGYRWFDEVANSLSGDARRCLYAGLKHQAYDLGLLTFVVDHHTEAANAADHVLLVEKSEGATSYRWE